MRNAKLIALALVVAAVAVLIAAVAAHSSSHGGKQVVKTARVAGKTILVNRQGHTLYTLSAERRGRFICTTRFCLSLWKPLVVAPGTKPAGARSLGTVKRPDGRRQVTYRGGPLYTFVQDKKSGDTSGDGFKDVGVWHPAVVAGGSQNAPSPKSGYGYGGGY
jgi:predicted lipoprotein with Yx(FWY)xxD motif